MTTQTTENPTIAAENAAAPILQATAVRAECTECSGAITANVALPGEILGCPDCGAELEVRSVRPLVLALAPEVEEDWGE